MMCDTLITPQVLVLPECRNQRSMPDQPDQKRENNNVMNNNSKPQMISLKELKFELRQEGFDISRRTLALYCDSNKIPGAKKVFSRWYVPPESARKLLGLD
jgi:hypothetical protein